MRSNDLCFYLPVRFEESVEVNDIVFCEVQPPSPGGAARFYAHLVKIKERDLHHPERCWKYWISNLQGRINGWCHLQHIYGKLFQVLHC